MKSEIAASMQAAKLMLVFTLLLGGGYTLIMTGLAQLFFPMQAAGSLHWSEDHTVLYGSRLMGQPFAADNHLWGRDMKLTADTFRAADDTPLLYGTATNEAVKSEAFATRVAARTAYIRAAHPEMGDTPVPVDLVAVWGAGLIRIFRQLPPRIRYGVWPGRLGAVRRRYRISSPRARRGDSSGYSGSRGSMWQR